MQMEQAEEELNPKQELFCQLYATDQEFFANGTQAYMEAYDIAPGKWKMAAAAASRLLTNVKILTRINELLELKGLNDAYVDKQLELLVTQNADFKSKLGAIKEYNKLKQRITEKIDHTTKGEKIENINYILPDGHNNPTNAEAAPGVSSPE
jgi:phage terminase small subunit